MHRIIRIFKFIIILLLEFTSIQHYLYLNQTISLMQSSSHIEVGDIGIYTRNGAGQVNRNSTIRVTKLLPVQAYIQSTRSGAIARVDKKVLVQVW